MTSVCECAARRRDDLVTETSYSLKPDGRHERLVSPRTAKNPNLNKALRWSRVPFTFWAGKSKRRWIAFLAARCTSGKWTPARATAVKLKLVGLNSPSMTSNASAFHFVASPRHADMLLVTGPVTRNMEMALRKTYDAMPAPRLVVAVGACGCSGGIFGQKLCHGGRRGRSSARGRLHSRLSAESARVVAWHSGGHRPPCSRPPNRPIPRLKVFKKPHEMLATTLNVGGTRPCERWSSGFWSADSTDPNSAKSKMLQPWAV